MDNTESISSGNHVVTLELDEASFLTLHDWRMRHFPPHRNLVSAHLSLFHSLGTEQISRLRAASRVFEDLPPMRLKFAAPRFLGNGVAIDVESKDLQALRDQLVDVVSGVLTRQDQQSFRAHVTIQNKVAAADANDLYRSLCAQFQPWDGQGTGLLIWRYLGGPWAPEARLAFKADIRC